MSLLLMCIIGGGLFVMASGMIQRDHHLLLYGAGAVAIASLVARYAFS